MPSAPPATCWITGHTRCCHLAPERLSGALLPHLLPPGQGGDGLPDDRQCRHKVKTEWANEESNLGFRIFSPEHFHYAIGPKREAIAAAAAPLASLWRILSSPPGYGRQGEAPAAGDSNPVAVYVLERMESIRELVRMRLTISRFRGVR